MNYKLKNIVAFLKIAIYLLLFRPLAVIIVKRTNSGKKDSNEQGSAYGETPIKSVEQKYILQRYQEL